MQVRIDLQCFCTKKKSERDFFCDEDVAVRGQRQERCSCSVLMLLDISLTEKYFVFVRYLIQKRRVCYNVVQPQLLQRNPTRKPFQSMIHLSKTFDAS